MAGLAQVNSVANADHHDVDEVVIVLLSKTGHGKSSLGNNLLQENAFAVGESMCSETVECQRESRVMKHLQVTRLRVTVVDTPGAMDTGKPEVALKELLRVVTLCPNGVDVFLIVLACGIRLTPEERGVIILLEKMFGPEIFKHCIVVFNKGDAFRNDDVRFQKFINGTRKGIKYFDDLLLKCGNRCLMIDSCQMEPPNEQQNIRKKQRNDLMSLIMETRRVQKRFTDDFFELAQQRFKEAEDELEIMMEKEDCAIIEVEKRRAGDWASRMEEWKRMEAEVAHREAERKMEEEKREERRRIELARRDSKENNSNSEEMKTREEERKRLEEDKRRWDEYKRSLADARRSVEEEKKRIEEERLRIERERILRENSSRHNSTLIRSTRERIEKEMMEKAISEGRTCFPADAVVQTPSGQVTMSQLSVGQSVLCMQNGALTYSPVYMWGHRDEASWSNSYVTVRSESAQLTLSSDHLLLIIDEMGDEVAVPAGDVCAGHTVQVLRHLIPDSSFGVKREKVLTVERCVMRSGLFAPFTMCGNIIVDGVLASCYIRQVSPALSHGLLWPVRFAWKVVPQAVGAWNRIGDDGMPDWVSVLANGILPKLDWLRLGVGQRP